MIDSLRSWTVSIRAGLLADSLGARFARGAFWAFLGTGIARAISMLTSIVSARLLGSTQFGELGMVRSTVSTFGVFAGLGLGLTATKYISEYRTIDPDRAGRTLGLTVVFSLLSSAVCAVTLYIVAPWIANSVLGATQLVSLLRVGALLLPVSVFSGALTGALAGLEAFRSIARIACLSSLVGLPLTLAGIRLMGVVGAITSICLTQALNSYLSTVALRKECARAGVRVTLAGWRTEVSVLWQFSVPAFLSAIAVSPFQWVANAMLASRPGGFRELGVFNAANQWRTALMFLPGVLGRVAMPMLSAEQHAGDGDRFDAVMDMNQSINTLVVVPITMLVLFLRGEIMSLYGADFAQGNTVLMGIAVGTCVAAIGSPAGSAIQAKGRMWLGAAQNLSWGIVYILVVMLSVDRLGANALALAWVIAYLFLTAWGYAYLYRQRLVSLRMTGRVFATTLLVLCAALLSMLVSSGIRPWLSLPVCAVGLWASLRVRVNRETMRHTMQGAAGSALDRRI